MSFKKRHILSLRLCSLLEKYIGRRGVIAFSGYDPNIPNVQTLEDVITLFCTIKTPIYSYDMLF